MRVERTQDLNITFYPEDVAQLKNRVTLNSLTDKGLEIKVKLGETERNRWFEVREVATIQDNLPFTDYEIFENHLETEKLVHGYNVILREDLFYKWAKKTEENPNSGNVTNPFWGRGIQFRLSIDRIHIMYRPTNL